MLGRKIVDIIPLSMCVDDTITSRGCDVEGRRVNGDCDRCAVVGDTGSKDGEGGVGASLDAVVDGGEADAGGTGRGCSVLELACDTRARHLSVRLRQCDETVGDNIGGDGEVDLV